MPEHGEQHHGNDIEGKEALHSSADRRRLRGADLLNCEEPVYVRDDVVMAVDRDVVALLRAKFEAVLPHLDERQQRLVMAGEARSLGHGGIAAVAQASGASRSRISAGVAELESGQAPLRRVRREGGGRKTVTVADPALLAALLALVEPTRRGDPQSPLCWTTLSTRRLAAELLLQVDTASKRRPDPRRRPP